MRRFILLSLLTASLAALPARPQADVYPRRRGMTRGQALIDHWVRQCLRRAPSDADWNNAARIDNGTLNPAQFLPQLFGCDEYYLHAGATPQRYIRQLFRDQVGREPTPREEDYWLHLLRGHVAPGWEGRVQLCSQFLQRYPGRDWAAPSPADDDHDYRRPHYRDHGYDDLYRGRR